jgi:hypothetical protein
VEASFEEEDENEDDSEERRRGAVLDILNGS